jgi:hypothetical protein
MNSAVEQALSLMGIALPTMFAVTFLFIFATKLLHKAFPGSRDCDEDGK